MFYSAIVFDFDGVIVESTDVKTAAFYELALSWGEDAASRLKEYHLSHFGISRFVKFEWFFQNVLGKELSASEASALSEKFTSVCAEKILAAPLVPGFTDAAALASRHCPLYVASAAPQKELEQILEVRGLHGLFKEIYGSPCQKSEVLKKIANILRVDPEYLLMVGDSPWDLTAAEEAGTDFYGRGAQFESSGYVWGKDLNNLVAHLSRKLVDC